MTDTAVRLLRDGRQEGVPAPVVVVKAACCPGVPAPVRRAAVGGGGGGGWGGGVVGSSGVWRRMVGQLLLACHSGRAQAGLVCLVSCERPADEHVWGLESICPLCSPHGDDADDPNARACDRAVAPPHPAIPPAARANLREAENMGRKSSSSASATNSCPHLLSSLRVIDCFSNPLSWYSAVSPSPPCTTSSSSSSTSASSSSSVSMSSLSSASSASSSLPWLPLSSSPSYPTSSCRPDEPAPHVVGQSGVVTRVCADARCAHTLLACIAGAVAAAPPVTAHASQLEPANNMASAAAGQEQKHGGRGTSGGEGRVVGGQAGAVKRAVVVVDSFGLLMRRLGQQNAFALVEALKWHDMVSGVLLAVHTDTVSQEAAAAVDHMAQAVLSLSPHSLAAVPAPAGGGVLVDKWVDGGSGTAGAGGIITLKQKRRTGRVRELEEEYQHTPTGGLTISSAHRLGKVRMIPDRTSSSAPDTIAIAVATKAAPSASAVPALVSASGAATVADAASAAAGGLGSSSSMGRSVVEASPVPVQQQQQQDTDEHAVLVLQGASASANQRSDGAVVRQPAAKVSSPALNMPGLENVPFRLDLSEAEREARASVVLPYEHQGKGQPLRIYAGRPSINQRQPLLTDHTGTSRNGMGNVLYVRDSDDEAYDSDEDPDDDLDI